MHEVLTSAVLSERVDDSGHEERHREQRADDAHVISHRDPDLPVGESLPDIPAKSVRRARAAKGRKDALLGDMLSLADGTVVAGLAVHNPSTLVLRKEGDCLWEIGDSPERYDSSGHGEKSLQNLVHSVSEVLVKENMDERDVRRSTSIPSILPRRPSCR